jgi:predicted DNA-binding transcriptional regulator AlpA
MPPAKSAEPDPFFRKTEVIKISGYGYSKFHQEVKAGRFPPADCYLSDRMPVWRLSTLQRWQEEAMAQPKPAPFRVHRT